MKKKLLALILCLVMVASAIATVGVSADDAAGYTLDEQTKTFTVTTADGLVAVAALINAGKLDHNVTLAADIDMAGKKWTPIGPSKDECYKGVFDGGNFTIKNLENILTYEMTGSGYCGLIGAAYDGVVVKNLWLVDANLQGVEFTGAIICETYQESTDNSERRVVVENVHIRNLNLKGLQGYGTSTASLNKNEYTGAIIGKTSACYTVVSNCSIVANIVSDYRTAGVIGGEAAASATGKEVPCSIEISNTIVGGVINHTSLKNKDGAGGFLGYHSTIPMTVTNSVMLATISSEKNIAGSIGFNSNKLSATLDNVIVGSALYGQINDVTVGDTTISNTFIYKAGETATELPVVADTSKNGDAAVRVNSVDTTWAAAKLPVINNKADLKTKIDAMFAGNTYITAQVIDDVIGHEHAFTLETVDAKFLKSAATCTDAAVYYKSCTCGAFDNSSTFTSGETLAHSPSDKWTNDADNHWHVCSTCLEEKSDVGAHTYGEWTVTREATEKREGERTKSCTVCASEISEKIEKIVPAESTDADTAGAADTSDNTTEAKGGCGSAVLGMGAVMLVTLAAGAFCLKKKED